MAEYKENYDDESDDGWPRNFNINTHNISANAASKQNASEYDVLLRTARRTDYKKKVLKLVGQISSWYGDYNVDKNGAKCKPLRTGTGTVFKTLPNHHYLVITCAHNICSHSPSNNTLLHPKDTYFFAKGMKEPKNRMKCVHKEIYNEYDPSKQQCPHDLAIALFCDTKGVCSAYYNDIKVDGTVTWPRNVGMDVKELVFCLWGYPVDSKGLLQGENGGEAMKTKSGFWEYDVPTYPGQSGSPIFKRDKQHNDTFDIYGIHVWGDVEKQENNCGVFLDKKKLNWIETVSAKFKQMAQNSTMKVIAKSTVANESKAEIWLKQTVGLKTDVVCVLLDEGYDNMVAIQSLTEDDLQGMGIKKGHRKQIIYHVQRLPKDNDSVGDNKQRKGKRTMQRGKTGDDRKRTSTPPPRRKKLQTKGEYKVEFLFDFRINDEDDLAEKLKAKDKLKQPLSKILELQHGEDLYDITMRVRPGGTGFRMNLCVKSHIEIHPRDYFRDMCELCEDSDSLEPIMHSLQNTLNLDNPLHHPDMTVTRTWS